MNRRAHLSGSSFTGKERDLIRQEFERRFGQEPKIADGIKLRVWAAGERRGQPKIPPEVQSMLGRVSRSCRTPHSPQAHSLTRRPAIPLGPLRAPHAERSRNFHAHWLRQYSAPCLMAL